MLVIADIDQDDALCRAPGDPDLVDAGADELALIGDEQQLFLVFHREGRHDRASPVSLCAMRPLPPRLVTRYS
jgi:hypothetical protein